MRLYYHIDFLARFEEIALHNDLRLIMQRAPVGCGIIFCFKDDMDGTSSPPLAWFYEKEDVDSMFKRLQKLADDFKSDNEWIAYEEDQNV